MEAIKRNITVNSDTLNVKIPELSNYMGRKAELILIVDNTDMPKRDNLEKLRGIVGKIDIRQEDLDRLRNASTL
jgi:hypothetical protein